MEVYRSIWVSRRISFRRGKPIQRSSSITSRRWSPKQCRQATKSRPMSPSRDATGAISTTHSETASNLSSRTTNELRRADITGAARIWETANRSRQNLLRQPQHNRREIDRERYCYEKNGIDRTSRAQSLRETNTDEFGRHKQNKTVRRRNQSERKRCYQDDAHVHRIDISCLGERVHQWHENDYRRHRFDEIADDREKRDHQQHDQMRVIASQAGNPVGDDDRAAQIGKEPPESIGCPDRNEGKRENKAGETKIISKKSDMAPVQCWNDNKENIDNRDHACLGWREPARENAS